MPFSSFSPRARHPRYPEHWKRTSSRRVTAVGSWTDSGKIRWPLSRFQPKSWFCVQKAIEQPALSSHFWDPPKSVSQFCFIFIIRLNAPYGLYIWFGRTIGHFQRSKIVVLYEPGLWERSLRWGDGRRSCTKSRKHAVANLRKYTELANVVANQGIKS